MNSENIFVHFGTMSNSVQEDGGVRNEKANNKKQTYIKCNKAKAMQMKQPIVGKSGPKFII